MRIISLISRRVLENGAPLVALCGLLGGALSGSSSAHAYVRSRATSCKPVYWAQSCLYVQADSDYVKDVSGADVEKAIQNAINAWQSRTSSTSFLQL